MVIINFFYRESFNLVTCGDIYLCVDDESFLYVAKKPNEIDFLIEIEKCDPALSESCTTLENATLQYAFYFDTLWADILSK